MITLNYTFYKNIYGGSLGETMFNSLLPKAQSYMNIYTNDTYGTASDDTVSDTTLTRLRMCTCAGIDILANNTDSGHLIPSVGVVTSETVGPWSKHVDVSSGGAKSVAQAFLKNIQFYLSGSKYFVTWA